MGFEHLTNDAKDGRLTLQLDDEQFDQVLKACDVYIDGLYSIKHDADNLGTHPLGFSEDHLPSGDQLSKKFQRKASGGAYSAASAFQSHIERAEEMKALFQALRTAYHSTDRGIAKTLDYNGNSAR